MESTLTIKPAQKSNFLKAVKPKLYSEITVDGRNVLRDDGEFKGDRIDGVKGTKRIKWDGTKYPTGSLKGDDLNVWVSKCKLVNDKYGHPDKGKMITACDPFDFDDPFFSHRATEIKLDEYNGTLSSEVPMERIFMEYVKSAPEDFMSSDTSPYSRIAKLKIIDLNREASDAKKAVDNSKQAVALYNAMLADKKIKLAVALKLVPSESTDFDTIDTLLWKLCTVLDNATEDRRNLFVNLASLSTEKFNNRYLVSKAQSRGKLKQLPKQGYLLSGIPIGLSLDDVYKYFDDPNNQSIINDLEKTLSQ